jgi:hypothetical protein
MHLPRALDEARAAGAEFVQEFYARMCFQSGFGVASVAVDDNIQNPA